MIRSQLLAFAGAVAIQTSALAQLPTARLDAIFPLGAEAGGEVELTVSGASLDAPRPLLFSHPGIKGEPAGGAEFKVTVAPEVKPGVYEARFAGALGVSSPRCFTVGDRFEAVVPAEAGDISTAPALVPGTVFNGRAEAGKAQFFKLPLVAGERVFVDCFAERIGTRLDALLVLFDSSGSEVTRSREARDGDPLLDFTAPAAGDYTLRISDFLARGGLDYGYRLIARKGPQIDFVVPPSAEPGKRQRFTLHGRNLPGGADTLNVEVDVPSDESAELPATSPLKPAAVPFGRGFHYAMDGSNRVFIAYASAPALPNLGTKVAVPCEVGGRFLDGAADRFEFDVAKGQSYVVEVVSQRTGALSDPVLTVTKADGGELGKGDDQAENIGGRRYRTDHRDPAVRFVADFDGTVRVSVRDQFATSSPYRFIVREPEPDFELIVSLPEPPGDNNGGKKASRGGLGIRRGEVARLDVYALRRDGFDGAIDVTIEGLPQGFNAAPLTIPKGQKHEPLAIAVAPGAGSWAGEVTVTGRAGELTREATPVSVHWTVNDANVERVLSRAGSGLAVASVAETAPLIVAPAEDKAWEVALGGTLEIPVKLEKTDLTVVKDKVIVRAAAFEGMGKKPPQLDLGKDKTEGKLLIALLNDRDGNKFTAGTQTFFLQASAKIGYKKDKAAGAKDLQYSAYTMPITVKITEP